MLKIKIMMKRKHKLIIIASLISVILIITYSVLFNKLEQIQSFNIKTYEQEIEEFSSQKIFGYTRYIGNIESSKMAKKYALQIWLEVYGKEVQRMKPYKVYWDDENNAWLVTGTLKKNKLGGIPYIIFSKDDGEIIAVWHTR
jgi:hypothetical protein